MASTSILEVMGGSPLKALAEYNRRQRTGDTLFTSVGVFFFELETTAPAGVGALTRFLFPLVMNPESYELEEPFEVEATKGLDAGLYVEENGIVERHIRISGHTGFKPKAFPKVAGSTSGPNALALMSPDKRSYSRSLAPDIVDRLSGQLHFMYLQDAVFRTYADLKRDPATAEGTRLYFHNPRDREHWLVVPRMFKVSRTAARNNLYPYEIDLLVVDRADAVKFDVSEDSSVMDILRDRMRLIKSGVDMASGALLDLTAMVGDIRRVVSNIDVILGGAQQVVDAASAFANGTTDLIQQPRKSLLNVLGTMEQALSTVQETGERAQEVGDDYLDLPATVKASMRKLGDGLSRIGAHPAAFETSSQAEIRTALERQSATTSLSQAEIDRALSRPPPANFAELEAIGTGLTRGEAESAAGDIDVQAGVVLYTGYLEHSVARGDTLVNLAAAYLGDARLWRYIAAANAMKPPFINEQADLSLSSGDEEALPSALGVGQKILIPTFAKPVEAQPLLAVMGVAQDEMAEVHLLGKDLELENLERHVYDVKIDTDHGSLDARTIQGVTNLKQAIILRLITERGRDVLFKQVGLERVVGFNVLPLDLETVLFRVASTVEADPRIASIRSVDIQPSLDPVDLVGVDVVAEVRGFVEPVVAQTKV